MPMNDDDPRTDEELRRDQRLMCAIGAIGDDLIRGECQNMGQMPPRAVVCALVGAGAGICVRELGAEAAAEYLAGIVAKLQNIAARRGDDGEAIH